MSNAIDTRNARALKAIHIIASREPPTVRRDLAEGLQVSDPTVTDMCEALEAEKVIRQSNDERAKVGRPPTVVSLAAERGTFIGVEVNDVHVIAATFDSTMHRLSETSRDLDAQVRDTEAIAAEIQTALGQELWRHVGKSLLGVGVAAPARLVRRGFAPSGGSALKTDLLERALPSEFSGILMSDTPARALACAELWSSAGRLNDDFLIVNVADHIDIAIVRGGVIVDGDNDWSGDWGHTRMAAPAGGRPCRCGATGCLDTWVGASGIAMSLNERNPATSLPGPADLKATVVRLRDAASTSDPVARDVIRDTGTLLGGALASLAFSGHPMNFVLGGWVADILGERLTEPAIAELNQKAPANTAPSLAAGSARDHEHAVVFGAAALAFEKQLTKALDTARSARGTRSKRTFGGR